jgi:hypothetical protein
LPVLARREGAWRALDDAPVVSHSIFVCTGLGSQGLSINFHSFRHGIADAFRNAG